MKYNIFTKLGIAAFAACTLIACSDDDEASFSTKYTPHLSNIKSVGEAVDLGLTSGTKWSSKNIGADKNTDQGILFVWGDITGNAQDITSATYKTGAATLVEDLFDTYKTELDSILSVDTLILHSESIIFKTDSLNNLVLSDSIKVILDSIENVFKADGFVSTYKTDITIKDEKVHGNYVIARFDSTYFKYMKGNDAKSIAAISIIGNEKYDAATANWGSSWQMPSAADLIELINECKWECETDGYKVTGPNGNSIHMPFAGYRNSNDLIGAGSVSYFACGEILGNYTFPSASEQEKGKKGTLEITDEVPYMIHIDNNYNKVDYTKSVFNSNMGFSIRPVQK